MTTNEILEAIKETIRPNNTKSITAESLALILNSVVEYVEQNAGKSNDYEVITGHFSGYEAPSMMTLPDDNNIPPELISCMNSVLNSCVETNKEAFKKIKECAIENKNMLVYSDAVPIMNLMEIFMVPESYKANTYTKFIINLIDYKGFVSDEVKHQILEENTDIRDDLFPDFITLCPNIKDVPIILLENGECMILDMFAAYLQTLI